MKLDLNVLGGQKFSSPAVLLATWFGVGLMKPAPGTWGTIAGVPFAILIAMSLGWIGLFLATLVLFFVGVWAAGAFEKKTGSHDQGCIVIDEVVGVWIALWCALDPKIIVTLLSCFDTYNETEVVYSTNPLYILFAVLFFRFFDILKPWPIGYLDRKISGGMGVMLDDVVAGIFAGLCVIGIRYAGFS